MSEETTKETAAPTEPTFTMPLLDKGAATFYDTNTKCFWVGIPLSSADPVTCLAILDRAKFDLLQHYTKMAQEMARLNALRNPPGFLEKAKKYATDAFGKFVRA